MLRVIHLVSALAVCLCLAYGAGAALAQGIGKQAQGIELLRAGEAAFAKGQYQVAARNYSKAMNIGDLTNVQVARALYQRGIAFEKSGRPANAIADISNALFIEGLPSADRAKAYLGRARAYEAVGMNKLAQADKSRARSGGASEQRLASSSHPVASAPGVPRFSTNTTQPGGGTAAPAFRTVQKTNSGAPQRKKVASFETRTRARRDQIPRFRTTIVPQEGDASASSSGSTSVAAQGSPPPQTQAEQSGGTVRRFVGNLWRSKSRGGDDKKQIAATSAAQPPQWNQTTTVSGSTSLTANAPAPRPVVNATPGQPAPAAGGGGYRVQLAALRSQAEAQAAWKRLVKKHRKFLDGYQPDIVRTELGGLGTFYRLQLGPFAEKGATQRLCNEFKRGGLDCFLLAS